MTYSIQVDNLRYRYPKSTEDTLKGLSFGIAPGEIFGFLGPSGSGKSTTQKILYKLLKAIAGRYGFTTAPWPNGTEAFITALA